MMNDSLTLHSGKNNTAKSIASLGEKGAKAAIKVYLKRLAYGTFMANPDLPEDYIDKDLSFFTGDEKSPAGVLLSHVCPSGLVRVEKIYAKSPEDLKYLLAFLIAAATKRYGKECDVMIACESEPAFILLEEWVPYQKTRMMIEGIMVPAEDDITKETVDELLSADIEDVPKTGIRRVNEKMKKYMKKR